MIVTKQYIEIVGLCFTFQGLGLSLYFASQGANAMKWPIIATVSRFVVAALGGWIAVNWFSSGIAGVFYAAASAMTLYGLMLVLSLKMGAWRRTNSATLFSYSSFQSGDLFSMNALMPSLASCFSKLSFIT